MQLVMHSQPRKVWVTNKPLQGMANPVLQFSLLMTAFEYSSPNSVSVISNSHHSPVPGLQIPPLSVSAWSLT